MVCDRAKGCCEYCLIPETLSLSYHQVDPAIAENAKGARSIVRLSSEPVGVL
jgi:5-methylcytosine-specific restriction enzyme A